MLFSLISSVRALAGCLIRKSSHLHISWYCCVSLDPASPWHTNGRFKSAVCFWNKVVDGQSGDPSAWLVLAMRENAVLSES
jgi:hypothetical protein